MRSSHLPRLLVAASALGTAGLLTFAGPDAPVRILGIVPLEQQDRVAFNTDQDDHYYVLRRGDTLAAIGDPVGLKVAPRGTNLLEAVRSSAATGFYTVERVPVASPVDSDGDGAHDLLELDFQPYRSPLTPADAALIPPAILDPLPELTTNDTVTVTGRAWPGTMLTIAGGSSVVSGAVAQAGTYSFSVNLRPNRVNKLFLTSGLGPNASAPVALDVVQDREPPTLFVDFPSSGSVTIEPTTTLAGRVGDVLSGALGLNVTVNGQPAAVAIGLGQNGTFDKPSLPLALGTNTFTIVARDALGNQTTRAHTVVRKTPGAYRIERVSGDAQFSAVHTLVPQPLSVRVIDGNGQPFVGKLVDFQVTRSDGELLPGPSFNLPRTRAYQVRTDETGLARAWWLLGGTAGCAADRVEATSVGVDGKATFCATARPGPASQINIGSGNNQVAEVGAPAPQTLRAWVNDSCNGIVNLPVTFTVTEGNGTVNGQSSVTVNTGPTGHAEVQFRLATDGTHNAVEATFAGNPGLPAVFTATGRIRNALQPTVFRGLVLDNANQPLGGAQVWAYVNGQAFPTENTDAQGFFELPDLPAGAGSLFVDGAFASQLNGQAIPLGSFPSLSYEVVVTANTINELPTPVRLPRLDPANSVVFNNNQDVILRCAGIEGLELRVKAGSMRKADGSLVSPGNLAILSLNQVHHDEVPMPMPDGASPPFAWTLQPGGATFDPPIEITYPNMSGLAPGATAYFLTYNHALEQFQIVSSGQVSEDGSVIRSDPGSGLNLAGWGCSCPPYAATGDCEGCEKDCLTPGTLVDGQARAESALVCVGTHVEFFAFGVVYQGGRYRIRCEDGERVVDANDATLSYRWRIAKPNGESVQGSGSKAVLLADMVGEYTCTFTAYLDPAGNKCQPEDLVLSPVTSEALSTRILVGDTPNGPVVFRSLTNGNYQGFSKIGIVRGSGAILLNNYLPEGSPIHELSWRVDGAISVSEAIPFIVNNVEQYEDFEVELLCDGPDGEADVLDRILIVVHSHETAAEFAAWEANNTNTSWRATLPLVYTSLAKSESDSFENPEIHCAESRWRGLEELNSNYHPGAFYEMRSVEVLQHGHQATYDANGNIITSGVGAGSGDFSAPIDWFSWDSNHVNADVRPFIWAAQLDGNPVAKAYPYLALGLQYLDLNQALLVQGKYLSRYLELRPIQASPGLAPCPAP